METEEQLYREQTNPGALPLLVRLFRGEAHYFEVSSLGRWTGLYQPPIDQDLYSTPAGRLFGGTCLLAYLVFSPHHGLR